MKIHNLPFSAHVLQNAQVCL